MSDPGPEHSAAHQAFGPYTLLSELGRGGQGTVWLAEDHKLKRKVALKLLNAGPGLHTEERLQRFRREAEAAARLDDPHICTLLDAGDVDGVPYLAFQHVGGETLAERVAAAQDNDSDTSTGRQGIDATVALIEKLARALHKAHAHGLIHRDVKPSNVMITPEGEPVLLDFGLAHDELADEQSLTHSGDLLGTPAYMSPEQLMAQRIPLDCRTDVYSLGATLYEALTLQRPYSATTRAELYQKILTSDATSAHSLNRQIPSDLQVVLETAMEKDRNRRYQTAAAFAEDLHRVLAFEPIRARPIGKLLRVRRWAQRHPAAALAVALLAVGLVLSLLFIDRLQAELETRRALGLAHASAKAATSDQMLSLMLALEAVDTEERPETVAELHRAYGTSYERARLDHSGMRVASAVFSPDGQRVLTACSDGFARLWDLEGNEIENGRFEHPDALAWAQFASRGDEIITACRNGCAYVWKVSDPSEPLRKFRGDPEDGFPHMSPEGTYALTVAGNVRLWNLAGGEPRVLVGHPRGVSDVHFSGGSAHVVTASGDGTARLWRTDDGECVGTFEHPRPIASASISPDGTHIVTGSIDSLVYVWKIDGTPVSVARGHGGAVPSVVFSPDGLSTLSAGADGTARLATIEGWPIATFYGHAGHVTDAAFHPKEPRIIVTASNDGTARIWDLRIEATPVLHHANHVRAALFFPDGTLLTGTGDGALHLWGASGADKGVLKADGLPAISPAAFGAAISPDGSRVAGAYIVERIARLWNLSGRTPPRELVGHTGDVRSVAFSPNGLSVLTASSDQTIRRWWFLDGREESLSVGVPVQTAVFSHDGKTILTACLDGAVRLFDPKGKLLRRFQHEHEFLFSAEFSRDGEQILVASYDGNAYLWDVKNPEQHRRAFPHESAVSYAEFSPKENKILTVSRDKSAYLWNSQPPYELITELKGHRGLLWRGAFSPDGSRVVTASWDRTARVWITDTAELIELARKRVIRQFTDKERERYRDLLKLR